MFYNTCSSPPSVEIYDISARVSLLLFKVIRNMGYVCLPSLGLLSKLKTSTLCLVSLPQLKIHVQEFNTLFDLQSHIVRHNMMFVLFTVQNTKSRPISGFFFVQNLLVQSHALCFFSLGPPKSCFVDPMAGLGFSLLFRSWNPTTSQSITMVSCSLSTFVKKVSEAFDVLSVLWFEKVRCS